MDLSKPAISIKNVVANAKFADKFDLELLASKLQGAEYNREKFPGLVYRMTQPKAVFLLFATGKVVGTGATSVENVYIAVTNLVLDLRRIGVSVEDHPEFTVQNIVSTSDIGRWLNLDSVALELGLENVEYEPEMFPGLVYRVRDPKVVVLIFSSGKIVITGAKNIDDAERAVKNLMTEVSYI